MSIAMKRKTAATNGKKAEPVYCRVCEMRELTPDRWTSYGGSGVCEVCERGAGHAPAPNPQSQIHNPQCEDAGGASLVVPVDQIEPDPDQPRKDFDAGELATLGQSLAADGQIVPVIVNVIHGDLGRPRYRIIDGERRWRAAKLAGLAELRVVVRDLDATTVLRLQGLANLERSDLNAIEEAEWCRRMTAPAAEGGGGLTQQQLAERLGVTQAEISNRIRVLRVPEWAMQLVRERAMSRKHALALLEYEAAAGILEAARKDIANTLKQDRGLGTATDFADDLLRIAWRATEALESSSYAHIGARYMHVDYRVELTDDVRRRLDVVEVDDWSGQRVLRAQNKPLAKKLLAAAEAKALKQAAKKSDRKDAKDAKGTENLSPAERKKKEEEAARKFAQRLKEWYHDWLRVLCAAECSRGGAADGAGWLAAWSLFERPDREHGARAMLRELTGHAGNEHHPGFVLKQIDGLAPEGLAKLVRDYAVRLLVNAEGQPRGLAWGDGRQIVDDQTVEALAARIGLDVGAAWRDDRASPMREKYFGIHSKEQLLELAKELSVPLLETQQKSVMVKLLLTQQRPLAMPREVAELAKKSKVQSPKSKVKKKLGAA